MNRHGLARPELEILRSILDPFSQPWERVGLFGSRATRTARPDSDIDLVVDGASTAALVDRLFTLFGDGARPISVDVVTYDRISDPPDDGKA